MFLYTVLGGIMRTERFELHVLIMVIRKLSYFVYFTGGNGKTESRLKTESRRKVTVSAMNNDCSFLLHIPITSNFKLVSESQF